MKNFHIVHRCKDATGHECLMQFVGELETLGDGRQYIRNGDFQKPRTQGGTPLSSQIIAEDNLHLVQDCYGIEGIRVEEIK